VTDISSLRDAVSGVVLVPSDADFAGEVAGFNLAVQVRPEVVVGAASTADVVAAVRFAGEHGIPVRVQSTGHGAHHDINDGLLVTTKRLDSVEVDGASRIATIGAGARWSAVITAADTFGLAPITGSSPSVGAVGYLLGGGLGPLARSHGFSSDWVRGFTVVTADGEVVTASAQEHPDLFWALRGGKGGLGVVTEARVELVDLPDLYAGALMFEGDQVEPALRAWAAFTATAPDEVTTSAAIIHFPPIDLVPEVFRGKDVLAVRFARPGDAATGESLAAPLRAAATPFLDGLGPMRRTDVALIHNDPADPAPSWGAGMLLDRIDDALVDLLLANVGPGVRTPFMVTELRHLGAAAARDVPGGSAAGGRESGFALTLIGAPDPSLFAEVLPGTLAGLKPQLAAWVSGGTNIHWTDWNSDDDYDRSWPAETLARLRAVRAEVDPDGRFPFGSAAH
jgi:FAD/FMN-containing dehydrogenase